VLKPELKQVRIGPADYRTRPDPEQRHDLVAIQIGPDPGQFLLLAKRPDPGL
jgi:hypothetical protein